jgi:hypothetical protein
LQRIKDVDSQEEEKGHQDIKKKRAREEERKDKE